MIVGSLLLILVAVVTLGLGLTRGSNAFLIGSIVASLLAAIALIVGARQAAAARTAVAPADEDEYDGGMDAGLEDTRTDLDAPIDLAREAARRRAEAGTTYGSRAEQEPMDESDRPPIPAQTRLDADHAADRGAADRATADLGADADLDDDYLDEDPPDEPPAQLVPPADAARVARMDTEVLVIDGRPRYHISGCVHLLGRESEGLPVGEAIELGFTPCSLCEPDSALLAEARRV